MAPLKWDAREWDVWVYGNIKVEQEGTAMGQYLPNEVAYPTSVIATKFYGLPKIHKIGTLLRSIVSSRGSIMYRVAKELAHIICPLPGQSPHHLKNTQYIMQHIKEVKLEPGEVMTSYDVKVLFTSVHIDPSINIVKKVK